MRLPCRSSAAGLSVGLSDATAPPLNAVNSVNSVNAVNAVNPVNAVSPLKNSSASVGIFINKHASLFQNGCVQQSVFLYKLFRTVFREVHLVTVEKTLTCFDPPFDDVPVLQLTDGLVAKDGRSPRFDVLVFVSGVLMDPPWLRAMQRVGTACVRLVCGNMYWLNQEEYVFGVHGVTAQNMMSDVREQWVLPMYEWSASYMRLLCATDVHVTPYVWDPDIIDHVARKDSLQIRPTPVPRSAGVALVIMEPNLSVHKTSLVPMLIANHFHRANPGYLAHVHHFCADDLVKRNSVVLSALPIQRAGLVTHYHRMSFPHVLHAILSQGHRVVVLSHVNQNDLNFLHLECMHIGVPIVHNCPPFSENGLAYTTEDLASASKCIARAADVYESARSLADHRAACESVLRNYSSKNRESAAEYARHVDRLCDESKAARHEFFRNRDRFFDIADDMFHEKRARRGKGRGVVLCADGAMLVSQAMLALTALRKVGCTLPVEIVTAPGAMDPSHKRALCDLRFGDVTVVDAGEALPFLGATTEEGEMRGFQIKPLALLATSFDEVLFLDCDVIVVQDPTRWFDAPEYRESGHLFWRDFFQYGVIENPYSAGTMSLAIAMGAEFPAGSHEVDSGMFLLDKNRCMRAVTYAAAMARMHSFFYKIMYGDKESFRLAFNISGTKFRVVERMPGIAGTREIPPPAGTGLAGWAMAQWSPTNPDELSHVHCTIRKYTRDDFSHAIDSILVLTNEDAVGMGFVNTPHHEKAIPMLWRAASSADPTIVPAPAAHIDKCVSEWRDVMADTGLLV